MRPHFIQTDCPIFPCRSFVNGNAIVKYTVIRAFGAFIAICLFCAFFFASTVVAFEPPADVAKVQEEFYPFSMMELLKKALPENVVDDQVEPLVCEIVRNFGNVLRKAEGQSETGGDDKIDGLREFGGLRDRLMEEYPEKDAANPKQSSYRQEAYRAMERRLTIWSDALDAANERKSESRANKTSADLQALQRATEKVAQYYQLRQRSIPGAKEWMRYLEVEPLHEHVIVMQDGLLQTTQIANSSESFKSPDSHQVVHAAQNASASPIAPKVAANAAGSSVVDVSVAVLPKSLLLTTGERVNRTVTRIDDPKLSAVQRRVISTKVVADWRAELEKWRIDTVEPLELLSALERYELTRGAAEMERLAELTDQLTVGKSDAGRRLGETVSGLYTGANVKLYISEVFLNHFLPEQDSRTMVFRDRIANQPVVGRSYNESDVKVSMIPNGETLAFSLDVTGNVTTASRSTAWIATLYNGNFAKYTGEKRVYWTEDGIKVAPARLAIDSRTRLRGIRTEIDKVPVFSALVREIVRSQYELRQDRIRVESRQRVTREVRTQLNREIDDRFAELDKQYQEMFLRPMNDMGLSLVNKGSATDEHWLLGSWRLKSRHSLGSYSPEPATPEGSFADLKLHETAINTVISRFEVDGLTLTIGQLRQRIGEKIGQPGIMGSGDHDEAVISFAEENSVLVRFVDGKIEIELSIAALEVEDRYFENFGILVRYETQSDENGDPIIARARDGDRNDIVHLLGTIRRRDQLPLRSIFGKIFSAQRPISVTPLMFEKDPRLENLAIGHCRIENGWFALAIVAETPATKVPQTQQPEEIRQARQQQPQR